jgi:hypothetical protein
VAFGNSPARGTLRANVRAFSGALAAGGSHPLLAKYWLWCSACGVRCAACGFAALVARCARDVLAGHNFNTTYYIILHFSMAWLWLLLLAAATTSY